MPFELGVNSFESVADSLRELSKALDMNTARGRRGAERTLKGGAEVIYKQMKRNAAKHIKTGRIYRSIQVMKPVRLENGRYRIKVGLPKIEGSDYYYAAPLEYGHSGPNGHGDPTPPHPFVRPAYDAKADEAYAKMKEELATLLFEKENS